MKPKAAAAPIATAPAAAPKVRPAAMVAAAALEELVDAAPPVAELLPVAVADALEVVAGAVKLAISI